LAALSLGGNQYPWGDVRVLACFGASLVILVVFIWVELGTKALPVMPMHSRFTRLCSLKMDGC